jgi:cytosine/adenosine deaminase-related metal-dependent hydrolase
VVRKPSGGIPVQPLLLGQGGMRRSGERLVDIGIGDGHIVAIAERLDAAAANEIDARGNLVTESYVNPHLHLCKVWTLPMMEEEALKAYHGEAMGKAMASIKLASKIKEKYAEWWIAENARRAAALAAVYGNLHIRAFADSIARRVSKLCGPSSACATSFAAFSTFRSWPSRKTASYASRARWL